MIAVVYKSMGQNVVKHRGEHQVPYKNICHDVIIVNQNQLFAKMTTFSYDIYSLNFSSRWLGELEVS